MWQLTGLLLVSLLATGSGQAGCAERNGRFAHPSQCDAYTECEDGEPQEKLCPDGLVFNPNGRHFAYPCQYPIEVDCSTRPTLQPARATEECPHSYGYYKLGDSRSCGQFVSCVEGKGYKFDCPEGLAFSEERLHCDWPDQVASCDAEAYLGFTCPSSEGAFSSSDFQHYRSPHDCSKYFVCVNGRPRLFSCPEGQGFSDEIAACDDADNVPGCIFQPSREPIQQTGARISRK